VLVLALCPVSYSNRTVLTYDVTQQHSDIMLGDVTASGITFYIFCGFDALHAIRFEVKIKYKLQFCTVVYESYHISSPQKRY